MPRYAVSCTNLFSDELTTEIIEAPDMFEAIKKSPKAFEFVKHVYENEQDHESFHSETDDALRFKYLEDEAFNCDGLINAVLIPEL